MAARREGGSVQGTSASAATRRLSGTFVTVTSIMNQSEHTFPLPETQVQALNQVEEELQHQPLPLKVRGFVRANRWQTLTAVCLTGVLVGVCLRRSIQTLPAG